MKPDHKRRADGLPFEELEKTSGGEARGQVAVDADAKALNYGLKLLSIRKRTKSQLTQRLIGKGFPETSVQKAITRLEAEKLLDDGEYAQRFIQEKRSFRPLGRRRMAYELKSKGIDDRVIESALSEFDESAESDSAYTLAQLKIAAMGKIPLVVKRKKIYDFLTRRGFSYELAREVIGKIR